MADKNGDMVASNFCSINSIHSVIVANLKLDLDEKAQLYCMELMQAIFGI